MLEFRQQPGVRAALRCGAGLALVVVTTGAPSCSAKDEPSTRAETQALDGPGDAPDGCLWETDELLASVDAEAPGLIDCGLFLGQQPLENECFANGLATGGAVQITINNCIDCIIHSTYVSTPSGKLHLYREEDHYGDDLRQARVDACSDFRAGEGSGANCVEPAVLYTCSEPLPDPSAP